VVHLISSFIVHSNLHSTRIIQPGETPLEQPTRVVTARLVRGAFCSPRRSRKQHLISTRRDGTGLPDSLWVLRSDTATASRRGLAFEGFEEEGEDSHEKNSCDDPREGGFFGRSLIRCF